MRFVVIKTHTHTHTTRRTCVNRFGDGEPAVCLLKADTNTQTNTQTQSSDAIIVTHLQGLEVLASCPWPSPEGGARQTKVQQPGEETDSMGQEEPDQRHLTSSSRAGQLNGSE